jgi:hypothetical protein
MNNEHTHAMPPSSGAHAAACHTLPPAWAKAPLPTPPDGCAWHASPPARTLGAHQRRTGCGTNGRTLGEPADNAVSLDAAGQAALAEFKARQEHEAPRETLDACVQDDTAGQNPTFKTDRRGSTLGHPIWKKLNVFLRRTDPVADTLPPPSGCHTILIGNLPTWMGPHAPPHAPEQARVVDPTGACLGTPSHPLAALQARYERAAPGRTTSELFADYLNLLLRYRDGC